MKKVSFIIVFSLFAVQLAFARPPKDMKLKYDAAKKIIHIELKHIVDDQNEDFIRKLILQKNDEQPINKYYRQQNDQFIFKKDIPIEAEEGDTIKVKAYASEGGVATASITIEEQEETEDTKTKSKQKSKKKVKKRYGY